MISEFIPDPEDLAALEQYEQGQKVTAQQAAGFPLDALPQTLRDICEEIISVRSVSPDIVGPCALAMVSAAAGKGFEVRTFADLTVRANIYLLVAAPSGTGKGRGVSPLIEPLAQEQIAVLRDNQERMLELRETLDVSKERYGGLKKTLAKGDFKTPEFEAQVRYDMKTVREEISYLEIEVDSQPRVFVEDTSVEALALVLRGNHEICFSYSPDASKAISNLLGRYNNSSAPDDGLYLKAFSGEPCVIDRVKHPPVMLESPTLSLLWLTQPHWLRALFENEVILYGGFLARCLIREVDVPRTEITPEDGTLKAIDREKESAYHDLIGSLRKNAKGEDGIQTIVPSPEASEAMRIFHNTEVVGSKFSSYAEAFSARFSEQCWRIAAVLHLATHPQNPASFPLSKETVDAAAKVTQWFISGLRATVSSSEREAAWKRLKRIHNVLKSYPENGVSIGIMRKSHGIETKELESLCHRFPKGLAISEVPSSPKGGRPTRMVRIPDFSQSPTPVTPETPETPE